MSRVTLETCMWLVLVILAMLVSNVQAQSKAQGYVYGEGCDRLVRLILGQSFTVSAFPPYPQYSPQERVYGLRSLYRGRGPQECTWVFEGRNCQPEFHQRIEHYERGDVDCEENYFLMGDENREERFCGFKRPPRHLNSTGTRLFMTHFARNGRNGDGTIVSRLSGVVRCSLSIPPPRGCTPTPRTCHPVTPVPCQDRGFCNMVLFLNLGNGPASPTIHCDFGPGTFCNSTGQACFETVPVNSTVPPLPPPDTIPGAQNCSEPVQLTCAHPGNCTTGFSWNYVSAPSGGDLHGTAVHCVAEPDCTCVFQGNACYSNNS